MIIIVLSYIITRFKNKQGMRTLTLVYLLILYFTHLTKSALFQVTGVGNSITSNFTLVDNVDYDLNFSLASQSITSGSTVGLKFSERYLITSGTLANCRATTNSAVSPSAVSSCTVTYYSGSQIYEVIMTGIFSSTTTYSFLRLGFRISNPYAEVTEPINLTIYNPSSTMVGYGTAYITTIKASVMTGCSIQSASVVTGANATHTYTFTPPSRLLTNSYLLVDLPIWYGTTGNEATSFLICTGLQGTDSTSLGCSIGTPITTQTLNITTGLISSNRSSSTIKLSIADLRNPWSVQPFGPISFQLMYGSYLTQACYNVYNTMTTPNTLSLFSLNITNLSINALNSGVRLVFLNINPFPRPSNRIMIQFPSQVTVSYAGSFTVVSQTSTQITLAGLTALSASGFSITTAPSTRTSTFKLTTYVMSSGSPYAIQTKTLTVKCNPGSITSATAAPTNTQVNSITTYTLTFTIRNRLQIGSFIEVVFPAQLSIQIGSASCSLGSHTCTIKSSQNISVIMTSAIAASSTLTISIQNVKNSNEALTTSSFTIYSYFDSLYDSLVDQVTSGVTATMTPRTITVGTVTPSSVTTFALGSYRFDLTLMDYIPAGGYIIVQFPTTVVPQSAQLVAASFSTSSCNSGLVGSNIVNITGCFAADMTTLSLSLNLSNIRNPPSFKPSSTFKIYTRGPSGSLVNFIDSGLTVTMTIPATSSSFSVNPNSAIVGQSNTYSFQISHTISPHAINDYVIITIPSLMTLPTTPNCNTVSGIASITCLTITNTQLKVTYLAVPANTIVISLQSLTNYLIGDQPVNFGITIFDGQDYQMQQFLVTSVTYSQSTLTTVSVNNNNNIALGQLSNITLTITNSLVLYASLDRTLTTLQIIIPPQFTIGSACTSTSGTCSVTSGSMYKVVNAGLSLTNFNVTMNNVLLNYFNPTSTSFALTYKYNNYNVSVKSSGIVVSIFCTSPCQRCSTTATTCQSCLPSPNTLIYHDSQTKTCAGSCISGKYPDTFNECQLCVSPCSTCLDAVNCSSCVTNMWLYNTACMAICPSTYFNSSNGRCESCQSPCQECKSLSVCITCLVGFYSNNWCVNASSCPSGTYANTTTKVCQSCQSPCSTCSLSQLNCVTCITGYLYYSNQCVQNCPAGMYQSSIYCFNCVSPCATCNSANFCTSCGTNYLNPTSGTCVDSNSCPAGTYANSTSMECKTCPTGCTSCLNSTNCTSCNTAIYLFYEFGCYTVCPSGTYQSGTICLACTSPCLTCRGTDTNCTSCVSPRLYWNNSCVNTCPTKTYVLNGSCINCMVTCNTCTSGTTCDTCISPLFFQNNQCVSTCSAGSFGDTTSNNCVTCIAPCSECAVSGSNCTQCISPQLQYLNGCVNTCPATYFQVRGSCKTCPNCLNCLDASTCLQCRPGYYSYNGVCYTSCPSLAPIADYATSTCGKCDQTCLTCENTAKNCTSCYSNTFLYKGSCLTQCPLGFIQDLISGTCKQPLIGNIIYFPFTFFFIFFFLVCIASKCFFPQTQNITTLAATISLAQFGSWCLMAYIVTVDYNLEDSLITATKFVGLACILLSIGVGVAFIIAIYKQYEHDKGILAWKQFQPSCQYSYRVVNILSCTSFRFFRFLYSRFYNRTFFTMYVADGQRFITTTNRLTFISLVTNSLPMIGVCAFVLYKKQIYDQTFFCALDTLILGFIAAVVLTIDSCKNKDHFESIKEGLPFLKYKNMGNDQSIVGQSLLSRQGQERQRAKSQIDPKDRDNIFKKITWLPNINKFGHLNILEENPDKDQIKSLPQYNEMGQYSQYDPNRISDGDGDRVIDDDLLFLQQQQEKRRREQEQRLEEQRRKKKRQQEQEQRRKKQEEQRRRRQLMEEDQRQRVDLQFPDLAAIDKVENKNGKNRKNPLDLLSNCKKVDEKPIDDKALKKLEQIGKKNGLDPNFMKSTFGVQKNHNAELLNQIIDKHGGVKRQSVKQLFNDQNDPQILQQLFGKNSKLDPKKLKQILNDPDAANMIRKLASKEDGIISAQIAKQLFDQNSKYTKEFTKNLLSDDNGMDPQKLKTLLKDANLKGKDSPLKALKKIGGENLENKELLNNMLGENSTLNPDNFTRVANDLSIKAIENLFKNKSKNSDIITEKILNNKKINLKNLAPILEDEELLQQLAEALGSDDPNLQQNLINLFKNADNIDPAKLKQMLADPIIRQKLLSKPVDPSFLEAILNKNSNSDLRILSNALKQMSDQSIMQTFKFDPEKNTDFKNLAQLFDANPKTDPLLVAKMLEPDMVKKLYVKGNDTKMLNKLVEKGSQFDPEVIKNVYGDQRNNIFDTRTDNMHNNNLVNFDEDKGDQFRSQKQYSLGFQKNNKNQANMSRTAGGVLSFLTPIVPINKNKKGFNESNQDGWTSQGQQNSEFDDDGEIQEQDESEQNMKGGKRKKRTKKLKKKLTDIRHPAQQIYLQRIEAPHEHAVRKASIRKKKKKVENPGVMDEDNDIFDMNF